MLQHIEIPSETCSLIPFLAWRPLESVDRAQSHFQRHCSVQSDHDIARKLREFNIPPAPMAMWEITDNQLEPLHIYACNKVKRPFLKGQSSQAWTALKNVEGTP